MKTLTRCSLSDSEIKDLVEPFVQALPSCVDQEATIQRAVQIIRGGARDIDEEALAYLKTIGFTSM